MLKRWKLTIEYQGTDFCGWQRQESGVPSIQQEIEWAIERFCGQYCNIYVAGRTDAGVHASGQVAHFDLDYGDRQLSGFNLVNAINAHLAKHRIVILNAEEVAPNFHARFDAVNKLYTYRVLNRFAPPSYDKNLVWHYRRDLDVDAMRLGAKYLLGQHDFSTFRAVACQAKSPIRTLDRLDIEVINLPHNAKEIRFLVEARSFLHHQVRNMVGALMLVGDKKWTPADIGTALAAKDRTKGPATAPADGLSLTAVYY